MTAMTHITATHLDGQLAELATSKPNPAVAPFYDLGAVRTDPQCHATPTVVTVPADRIGLHLDHAGHAWLTVHHPSGAGQPSTLLGLDDETGRTEALAVICRAAVALQDGDGIERAAAVLTVEHRGAAGGAVLDPTMADHLTIVAAHYLTPEGIEVRA